MWQEITVLLIVIFSVLYIGWRYWKKFNVSKGTGLEDCKGSCNSCKARRQGSRAHFDQQKDKD
ncbi:MAG: FeoB-associated Cys-rich membrane protein [Deltaproteobacteria bacterium]|nr:FeoB-associated Cys-rich membrane protein [Deltaproteobacteria bacterium]